MWLNPSLRLLKRYSLRRFSCIGSQNDNAGKHDVALGPTLLRLISDERRRSCHPAETQVLNSHSVKTTLVKMPICRNCRGGLSGLPQRLSVNAHVVMFTKG